MATESSIISDFKNHFSGKRYQDCYVGIAKDARDRLFKEHGVSEQDGHWIYRTADGHRVARNVEKYFIDAGMDGGPSGGDESTQQVYAYKKTSSTKP